MFGQAYRQIHFDVLSVFDRVSGNTFDQWTVYKTVTESGTTPSSSLSYKNSSIKEAMSAGKVLYNNDSGTTGTVTLYETAANFRYIEIIYSKIGSPYHSVKSYSPNGKEVSLILGYRQSSTNFAQIQTATVTISGTQITRNDSGYINFGATDCNSGASTEVHIHRVIGYRG